MGTYSDIGLAIDLEFEKEVLEEASPQVLHLLRNAERHESEKQALYVFEHIKWYLFDPMSEVSELMSLLHEEEQYMMLELCEDGTTQQSGFLDNDFGLGFTLALSYDV